MRPNISINLRSSLTVKNRRNTHVTRIYLHIRRYVYMHISTRASKKRQQRHNSEQRTTKYATKTLIQNEIFLSLSFFVFVYIYIYIRICVYRNPAKQEQCMSVCMSIVSLLSFYAEDGHPSPLTPALAVLIDQVFVLPTLAVPF